MTTTSADWAEILKAVALEVLGQPTERRGNEWRYGRHGSLVVNISGQRAGSWRDFEAGHEGGVLELLRHYQGLDKGQALEWLRPLVQAWADFLSETMEPVISTMPK